MSDHLSGPEEVALLAVLEEARELGFLGPGPVEDQIARSLGFATNLAEPDGLVVDLGSGGGLPGLALAMAWKATEWVLLDANHRRTDWLAGAVERLDLRGRVAVACARAEVWARGPNRQTASLVVARSFGPPAPTAECAAPILRIGGILAVAEPPGGRPERWPADGLALVGLRVETITSEPIAMAILRVETPCSDRYPRRTGIPEKRPLF